MKIILNKPIGIEEADIQERPYRMLNVLGASDNPALTLYAARERVKQLLQDPKNRDKWLNRPIEDQQRRICEFFDIDISDKQNATDVHRVIKTIMEDPLKSAAWTKHLRHKPSSD